MSVVAMDTYFDYVSVHGVLIIFNWSDERHFATWTWSSHLSRYN